MHREGSPAEVGAASEPFPVAHVHWTLPPVAGGVETHLAEFARLLAARGHPVTIFTGKGGLEHIPGVRTVRTEYLDLDQYSPGPPQAVLKEVADGFAAKLRTELERHGIRVVHGHNLHHFTPVPAMALSALQDSMGIRVHHTYHSVWENSLDIAELCRTWPGQYALSTYVRDKCESTLGLSAIHTRPGVPHDRYDAVSPPRADRRTQAILLPARLVREKGADLAIRMLHVLRGEGLDARLILTTPDQVVDWEQTSGRFRKEIDELVAELELRDHVSFRGVRFEEMPRLYAESDIVIYPSVYPEPLGIAPLEAAAAGRPVVVTDTGGLRETVEPDVTGYVIPPGDLEALTDRVRTLLTDRELAHRMGEAGKRFVRRSFALEHYVGRMVDLYRSTLLDG